MGSMLRRCNTWDYRQRGIYMITLTVDGRVPRLGHLSGGESSPTVIPTPVGEMVAACWKEIPSRYPGVTLMEYQVMPDHFHGIVFVREPQPKPLGAMIGAFKSHSASLFKMAHAACGTALNEGGSVPCGAGNVLCPAARGGGASGPHPSARSPSALWSSGFQDTILFHKGQLANMRAYILDNPRRLAVKRAHPDLFKIIRDLPVCGTRFAAIGNHFLLSHPVKRQIQCSRTLQPTISTEQEAELLDSARHGAVLVSPCISPGEKRIAHSALAARLPLIVVLENGFPPLYKPPKAHFEACAAGRLLMLAPWPYHSDKRTITRSQCLELNLFAKRIAESQ